MIATIATPSIHKSPPQQALGVSCTVLLWWKCDTEPNQLQTNAVAVMKCALCLSWTMPLSQRTSHLLYSHNPCQSPQISITDSWELLFDWLQHITGHAKSSIGSMIRLRRKSTDGAMFQEPASGAILLQSHSVYSFSCSQISLNANTHRAWLQ